MQQHKVIYKNKWIELRTINNYIYCHLSDSNSKGVAILPYKIENDQFYILGRFEKRPCHDKGYGKNGNFLTSITGSCDKKGLDDYQIALEELIEEAGIYAKREELIDLGYSYVSKSSDNYVHLFAIDIKNHVLHSLKPDGEMEKDSYVKWITPKLMVEKSNCPLSSLMFCRLMSR